jgi:Ni/Co efflux regulator RcnB
MVSLRLVLLIVLTTVVLTPAVAQQRDPKTKKSSRNQLAANREREELRLSAVSLLHSLPQSANEVVAGSFVQALEPWRIRKRKRSRGKD